MWETFQRAAPFTWLILGAAALGGLATFAALITLRRRPRAALGLAAGATLFAMGCAGFGAADAWRALSHVAAERVYDVDVISAPRLRRLRNAYLKAQAPARMALLACVFPLVGGVALMFAAARRRAALIAPPPDPEDPFVPRAKLGVPVVLTVAGALVAALPASALFEQVPGGGPSAEEAASHLDADLARVEDAADHKDILYACTSLEDALYAGADARETGLDQQLRGAARRCVEERMQGALLNQEVESIRWQLEEIRRSVLVESDPALRGLVESTITEVATLPRSEASPID